MELDDLVEVTAAERLIRGPSGVESVAAMFGNQRRLTWQLLSYWEGLRGDREFPRLRDVASTSIPQLWPYCFVLDVGSFRSFPFFRYIGPALARYSGVYLGGKNDTSATLLTQAVCRFQEALDRGAPVLVEEDLTQYDNRKLSFHSVLLPLSDDQESINYLLGAANGTVRAG